MIVITKFLPQLNSNRYKKNQLIDLQEPLEHYCNVLPVFGFNSAKYDPNLIKSCLLPILVNEQDIEPIVIKIANQFFSCKFGGAQLLDITKFLGGVTSFDSTLKTYKTKETERFSTMNGLINLTTCRIQNHPPYDAFYSKLRCCNPLETKNMEYIYLLKNGLTTGKAVVKLKLIKPPPSGFEIKHYLQNL